MIEVKVQKGEVIERALARLKKKMDAQGVLETLKAKRRFMSKGQRRKYKQQLLERNLKKANGRR